MNNLLNQVQMQNEKLKKNFKINQDESNKNSEELRKKLA